MSDIGATSPGRWQLTHLAYMIGATSRAERRRGGRCADADCCGAPLVTVEVIPSHTIPTEYEHQGTRLESLESHALILLLIPRQRPAARCQAVRRTLRIPSSRRPCHRRRPDRDRSATRPCAGTPLTVVNSLVGVELPQHRAVRRRIGAQRAVVRAREHDAGNRGDRGRLRGVARRGRCRRPARGGGVNQARCPVASRTACMPPGFGCRMSETAK